MKTKITISFVIVLSFGLSSVKSADNLEIFGGNFTIDKDYNYVKVYNDAIVDMYNFSLFDLAIYNNSTFFLYGGNIAISGNINVWDTSTYNMFDGHIGIIDNHDSSIVNVFGGLMSWIFAYDDSTVHLYGGNISTLDAPGTNAYIHIYGYELIIDEYDNLTGYWQNGDPFEMKLRRRIFYPDHYVLHEIPEPHSLLFLGLGSVILRRRTKSSSQ